MDNNTNMGPQWHYVLPDETIAGAVPGPARPATGRHQKAGVHHA